MHIYENYEETQGWNTKEFGSYSRVEASYFTKEMSSLISAIVGNDGCRVLDIGFGDGAFMGWCRDNNIRCDGLEVNLPQVGTAKSAGYSVPSYLDVISGLKCRAVAGFYVLEFTESCELAVLRVRAIQCNICRDFGG
ncbi:MAG: hypothetical protein JHD10_00545 [Sphingomonadaceae bacterium]|nr:hypothetical protein [Sphingomonadaceae bacterium]